MPDDRPLDTPPLGLATAAAWNWAIANPANMLYAGVVIFAAAFFLLRTRESDAAANMPSVVESWSGSFHRLDISAIYPPREDVYVGDVFAVVTKAPDAHRDWIGKSLRLSHLQMDDELAKVCGYSGADCKGAALRDYRTHLAFPSLRLELESKQNGGVSFQPLNASGLRNQSDVDEIVIDHPVTYGVEGVDALIKLIGFCKQSKMSCDPGYIGALLAAVVTHDQAISESVCSDESPYRFDIQIVSRVFLTSKLLHTHDIAANFAAKLEAGEQGDSGKATKAFIEEARKNVESIKSQDLFIKPLAFGYQYVTVNPCGK